MRKKKKSINEKNHHTILWATLSTLLVVILLASLILFQESYLEKGILDICAIQQDAYVQLVLDQINLVDDREDEEIINNILSTMDASNNKYWTLDKQESLIFVKDVSETNKYKGFTSGSYYITDSAHAFLNGLQENKVTHTLITINNNIYIASGVLFYYNDNTYRLCLLTNRNVVLDHNAYMSVKINLTIAFISALVFFFLMIVFLARGIEKWRRNYDEQEKANQELRNMVQRLSDDLTKNELYDTKRVLFHSQLIPTMLKKLDARGALPIDFLLLQYDNAQIRDHFLLISQTMLDRQVLRFRLGNQHILLICIQCMPIAIDAALSASLEPGIRVVANQRVSEQCNISLYRIYHSFLSDLGLENLLDS